MPQVLQPPQTKSQPHNTFSLMDKVPNPDCTVHLSAWHLFFEKHVLSFLCQVQDTWFLLDFDPTETPQTNVHYRAWLEWASLLIVVQHVHDTKSSVSCQTFFCLSLPSVLWRVLWHWPIERQSNLHQYEESVKKKQTNMFNVTCFWHVNIFICLKLCLQDT